LPVQDVKDESGKIKKVDLGMVGEVVKVNPGLLIDVIKEEMFIPIVSPIGITEDGISLNINADTAACEIAKALKAEKLMLLTDVKGVLDQNGEVLSELKAKEADILIKKNVIKGGMIPKIKSALDAIDNGVHSVAILDGQIQHAVLLEIFTDRGVGTLIH